MTSGRLAWAAAVLAVVGAALVLRLVELTHKSLSFDALYSIFIASQPAARTLALTAANDAHPPLYYLLLNGWIRLFGDGEGVVRIPSVIIGTAVVLATCAFGRRLVCPAAALLGAGLVALTPAQVSVSQDARMYALLTLAALGSWWALWAALTEERRRDWLLYAILVAVTIYAHYYGVFMVASQAGYLIWRRTPLSAWRRWVYSLLGSLALLLPWLPAIPEQLATGHAWPSFRPALSASLFVDALTSMGAGQFFHDPIQIGGLPRAIAWPAAVLVAPLAVVGYRALDVHRESRALLISSALFPLMISFVASLALHVFSPLYLVFAMPGLALVMGAGVAALVRTPRPAARAAAVGAIAVLLVLNVGGVVHYYREPRPDVFDWRRVALTVGAQARPDDAFVFLPGFSRIPVNYYFRGPQPRLALTPAGPDVIGDRGIRMPGVVDRVSRHPRVWIVTVLPVPLSVETLINALRKRSYAVTKLDAINYARVILLERPAAP
ncbi:MAG: glycosyltransferase family 39 protein [Armatimonadota bacterium]